MAEFDPTKGGIYVPFIDEHTSGITRLNKQVNNALAGVPIDLLLAFDFNGSFLADQLDITETLGDKTKIIEFPTLDVIKELQQNSPEELPESLVEVLPIAQAKKLFSALTQHLAATAVDAPIQLLYVTPFEEGNVLLEAWTHSFALLMQKHPNLQLHIAVLQQTIQFENPADPAEYLRKEAADSTQYFDANRLHVYSEKVKYLLGHDVDYQINPNHPDAQRPILVFNTINDQVEAFSLSPSENATCRDVVLKLIRGEFKGKLGELY